MNIFQGIKGLFGANDSLTEEGRKVVSGEEDIATAEDALLKDSDDDNEVSKNAKGLLRGLLGKKAAHNEHVGQGDEDDILADASDQDDDQE